MQNNAIRKYIRHPSGAPIHVVLDRVAEDESRDQALTNISLGGLSFISAHKLEKQQKVRVCIPIVGRENYLEGRVVWCEKVPNGFEIGLEFDNPQEVFRLRMIEQICHIEHYRKEVERKQGRSLSIEEAAQEWISEYAGDFPAL